MCGLNLELLTAVAAGAGEDDLTPVLDPGSPALLRPDPLPGATAAAE